MGYRFEPIKPLINNLGIKIFLAKQKRTIEKMAKEGKTLTAICELLFGEYRPDRYKEIQNHCWESGCLGWIGAKRMISSRLKYLKQKNTSNELRIQKVDEIKEYMKYLYDRGRDLEEKLGKLKFAVQKTMDIF